MLRRSLAILAALALTSCDNSPVIRPPPQYRAPVGSVIIMEFKTLAEVNAICPTGGHTMACAPLCSGIIYVVPPGDWPSGAEWAANVEHEAAHARGGPAGCWPANHPQS